MEFDLRITGFRRPGRNTRSGRRRISSAVGSRSTRSLARPTTSSPVIPRSESAASAAPSPIDGRSAPLEGLSKRSANLVAMYDLGDFSARLAYNWRSDYTVGSRLSFPSNDGVTALTPVTMKGYGMVDAYLSYAITPRLRIALEGNNLTRTVRRSVFSDYGLPRGTYTDDRRFAISLRAEL